MSMPTHEGDRGSAGSPAIKRTGGEGQQRLQAFPGSPTLFSKPPPSSQSVPWERLLQVDVVTVPLQRAAGVPQERGRWLSLQEDTLS